MTASYCVGRVFTIIVVGQSQGTAAKALGSEVNGDLAVHEDARLENIMARMEDSDIAELKLIDMGWAGPQDATWYPA